MKLENILEYISDGKIDRPDKSSVQRCHFAIAQILIIYLLFLGTE